MYLQQKQLTQLKSTQIFIACLSNQAINVYAPIYVICLFINPGIKYVCGTMLIIFVNMYFNTYKWQISELSTVPSGEVLVCIDRKTRLAHKASSAITQISAWG